MSEPEAQPGPVRDLAQMVVRGIAEVFGIEPDYTPETLPLVDAYLRQVPPDVPAAVRDLVAASAGCYFGEVVRRMLRGRWTLAGESALSWRIELESCFLHFSPVGMAGEVLEGRETDEFDGSFATLDELWDGLAAALRGAAPVSEEEYYSLSARIDILHLAADWLVGINLRSGRPVRCYSADDYRQVLDRVGMGPSIGS